MTADTRRVFAYSFPYLTPFYNVPVSFGNRNAGKVFIWQSKRNASSRTRLKAYPYEGNTSCDLFRTVGGITLNEYLYLFVALEYTDLKLLVNYYNSRRCSFVVTNRKRATATNGGLHGIYGGNRYDVEYE
ncbi:hypothetical protein NDU88_004438 [Pleurodeles waltl]|uniref:Uncharacterized protein n=1 Tax=Pleurodeles waltl TaxID=8319 RepID=A0AAV7KXV6_PLEWA|nr:hypothetical protein NDU88_004438 [Pleurodeles waltl]